MITYAYNFDFNLAVNNLTDIKPVNITVTDVITMTALPELAAKPTEIITTDLPVEAASDYQLPYSINEVFDYNNPAPSTPTKNNYSGSKFGREQLKEQPLLELLELVE